MKAALMKGMCNDVKTDEPETSAEKGVVYKPAKETDQNNGMKSSAIRSAKEFSIVQSIRSSSTTYGGEIATIDKNGVERTYRELHLRVASVGTALVKTCGLSPKGRAAIISLNSVAYFEYYYAVPWAGGWVVPINIRLQPAGMIETLNDCTAEMLFLDETFVKLAPMFKKEVKSLKCIIYLGEGDKIPEGCDYIYESLIDKRSLPDAAAVTGGDDVYGLWYTGGTTGKSKGVMLTHTNVMANAYCILYCMQYKVGSRYLHCAPMFHAADCASTFGLTMVGSTHTFMPKFTPVDTLKVISARKVTHSIMVPTMFAMIAQVPDYKEYDLSSGECFIYGGSAMPRKVLESSMEIFPNASFVQGYGMTECSPIITLLDQEEHKKGSDNPRLRSVGRAVPHVELKVVDQKDQEVTPGSVGELCVRGPNVMKGYYNMPERTAEALKNGWMHTGDGACIDKFGFVYIKDRIKDMILTGGENVYSAEVEDILSKCKGVAMCAVIGIPDDVLVEKICAIIVPSDTDEGKSLTAEKVKSYSRVSMDGFKIPREVVIRQEPLPLSGAGKILKTELRRPYWEKSEKNDVYAAEQRDGAH